MLALDDVYDWEKRHGEIPKGAFVAMRTDWSKRWPDDAKLANKDAAGVFHYPGWSMEVLQLLYEKRGITASGHETTDTDPGLRTTHDDYSLESYILGLNHYQIELLANLDQLPESGAVVWVTFPGCHRRSMRRLSRRRACVSSKTLRRSYSAAGTPSADGRRVSALMPATSANWPQLSVPESGKHFEEHGAWAFVLQRDRDGARAAVWHILRLWLGSDCVC